MIKTDYNICGQRETQIKIMTLMRINNETGDEIVKCNVENCDKTS